MELTDAALGARVRAARTRRGWSVRGLAGRLGISPATLSQVERGRTGLTAVRLHAIAEALGTTVAAVLAAEVPESPAPRTPARSDWRRYEPLDFDPVLRAALAEIVEIGYHGATVRGIAARCGFSVSGIYHHYTSKQQMLVAILERTMTELLARARGARAEGSGPVQRFGLLVEHLALFHTHRHELGFVGASEMRSLAEPARRRIAGMRTAQQRMVDDEVRDAVRAGEFRADHPHEAARAVVTMCTALAGWWRPDGRFGPEETAAQYVDFALAMMRSR